MFRLSSGYFYLFIFFFLWGHLFWFWANSETAGSISWVLMAKNCGTGDIKILINKIERFNVPHQLFIIIFFLYWNWWENELHREGASPKGLVLPLYRETKKKGGCYGLGRGRRYLWMWVLKVIAEKPHFLPIKCVY